MLTLFLAVQFVDLLTNLLIAVGIEKIQFLPHHLATGAVKLVHIPYSHGLAANVAWAIIALFRYVRKDGVKPVYHPSSDDVNQTE